MSRELPLFLIDAGELLQHVSRVVYREQPAVLWPQRHQSLRRPGADLRRALPGPRPVHGADGVGVSQAPVAGGREALDCAEGSREPARAGRGVLDDVRLADLTAEGVMAGYFGLNLEQLASRDYTHTQQVSAQVHAMLGDDGQPLFDGCSIRRATTIPPRASPCSSVRQQESALSMTSTWWTMWTGRASLPRIASAWSLIPGRWNRMTKRPEAAREHIEAPNRMKWTKLE